MRVCVIKDANRIGVQRKPQETGDRPDTRSVRTGHGPLSATPSPLTADDRRPWGVRYAVCPSILNRPRSRPASEILCGGTLHPLRVLYITIFLSLSHTACLVHGYKYVYTLVCIYIYYACVRVCIFSLFLYVYIYISYPHLSVLGISYFNPYPTT